MPLCQSHTTTKTNAFILNLVVFSPEGERHFYSFEFTPGLEDSHVKFSSTTVILLYTHTDCKSHSSSRSYKLCIKIIIQSRVPGAREINVGQPQEVSSTSANAHSLGWITPTVQMCKRLCWLIFSQDSDWAANLQTQLQSDMPWAQDLVLRSQKLHRVQSHKLLTLDLPQLTHKSKVWA